MISERLRILQESAAPHFTPVPPNQPPYPECELQEWKTGAWDGHHWGGWGSQGKGQDSEALMKSVKLLQALGQHYNHLQEQPQKALVDILSQVWAHQLWSLG